MALACAAHGELEAGIGEGGGDAVLGFAHSGVGQADDDDAGVTPAGVDLDFDGIGFDAVYGGRTNPRAV
jgi:hypothetical protein